MAPVISNKSAGTDRYDEGKTCTWSNNKIFIKLRSFLMYKIIDGHVHLFPDRLMNAIINWFERLGCEMPFNWSYERHIEYLHNIGVSELMVLGYVHKAGMSKGINKWLADLSDKYPEVKPYACVHQDDIKLIC
jgi:hypothetical protein